jgi:transposase
MENSTKAQKLKKLLQQLKTDAPQLPLAQTAADIIPPEGSFEAKVMFIGEAAGYHEYLQKRPFVGAAGKLLTESLSGLGIKRQEVWITNILKVSMATVWRIRKEFFKEGLESAIYDKKRPGKPCKMNDKQEAMLIATACSKPPEGRVHWTLRLLANKMVELEVIEDISHETVRKTLKKTSNKTMAKEAMVHSQN